MPLPRFRQGGTFLLHVIISLPRDKSLALTPEYTSKSHSKGSVQPKRCEAQACWES